MKTKKPKAAPVAIKAMSFQDIIAEAQARNEAERVKFEAMSPAEQAAYIEAQKKEQAEIEVLLRQLRGPGFLELRI